jgi:hypothetical protein
MDEREIPKQLKAWANALESDKYRQGYDEYHCADGTICVVGVLLAEHGYHGGYSPDDLMAATLAWDAVQPIMGNMALIDAIIDETVRIKGARRYDTLQLMNDYGMVDFETFARAIRAVALRMEEQDAGEPVPVREREMVTAGVA